jgi:hypothetical protein
MKRNNPNIPILIREAAGTQPKVFARYGSYSTSLEALGNTRAIYIIEITAVLT